MNRGLEIVRRFLLSCLWIVGSLFVILVAVICVRDYLEVVSEEPAMNLILERFEHIDKHYSEKLTQVQAEKQLERITTINNYDLRKDSNERSMWISIGILLSFPFVGYGVHRLINWILVYRAED